METTLILTFSLPINENAAAENRPTLIEWFKIHHSVLGRAAFSALGSLG